MALSEKEQRLLAQMEAALAAEDPKLVNSFRGGSGRRAGRNLVTIVPNLGRFADGRGHRRRSRPTGIRRTMAFWRDARWMP